MAHRILLKNILSQNAHFQVNKALIQSLGLVEAAVISLLVDAEMLFSKEANENRGWFYLTLDKAKSMLNIGRRPYETALNNIINAGLVETELRDCPPKKYFRLNHSRIFELLSLDDEQINLFISDKSICAKRANQFVQNEQINLSEMNNNKDNINTTNSRIINNTPISSKEIINKEPIINYSPQSPQGVCEEVSVEEQMFESFRRIYKGNKRGCATEFENFRKKHKDWKEVLPTLCILYQKQQEIKEQAKRNGAWIPQEKNLQTYINNRCWEEEVTYECSTKDNNTQHDEIARAKQNAIEDLRRRGYNI